jgi:hypothetical protein
MGGDGVSVKRRLGNAQQVKIVELYMNIFQPVRAS